MGDGTPASRPANGNPAPPASPLRIFTRIAAGEGGSGGTATSPTSAFASPPEDAVGGLPAGAPRSHGEGHGNNNNGRATKAAPRMGRQGAHYHPLPSHWRDYGSSPSSAGSPVTPESGGGAVAVQYPGAAQPAPMAGIARSPSSYMAEVARAPHIPRDHRAKLGFGHSPAGSAYAQVSGPGDAAGSVAGAGWAGDRPGSRTSHRSVSQQTAGSSPMDLHEYGGLFPPPGTLAARSGMSRGTIGASGHQPSASTSSLYYSLNAGSPVPRGPGTAPQTPIPMGPSKSLPLAPSTTPSPAFGSAAASPDGTHGEDIVRRYFGRPPPVPAPPPPPQQQAQVMELSPLSDASSGSSAASEAANGIVYRRAVSSGDLPALDELQREPASGGGERVSSSFLSHDLVESPLEALVRRLTIELFQLYVNEDRLKGRGGAQPGTASPAGSPARAALADGYEDIAESLSRVLDPLSTDDGYVQQFRLGPSVDSGSSTPAVTMEGYFMPHGPGSRTVTPTGMAAAGAGSQQNPIPRPRPRHRQLERTWMEEALIKARRVSTIDETAGEAILQGLDMEGAAGAPRYGAASLRPVGALGAEPRRAGSPLAGGSSGNLGPVIPRSTRRGHAQPQAVPGGGAPWHGLPSVNEDGNDTAAAAAAAAAAEDGRPAPRSHYRARDPAAPHRKAAASISPARASLLRAVGRRQSVRLQPGRGQIVVADTPMGVRADEAASGNRGSIVAPVLLDPETIARAKRTNSLPGIMQVPETREVSYRDIQRKAARQVELKRAAKPRARVVRRAERMVRGGTQPTGVRKRHHRRAGSRAPDMEQLLVRVELPPPVPLRVRRQQLRMAPEPLILVCRPSRQQQGASDAVTAEQKIQRVHNQLLGAQAVLSRHDSALRQANAATRSPGKNTVRSQALDAMMLDSAFGDPSADTDDDGGASRGPIAESANRHATEPDGADAAAAARPWRNVRRRSTLRQKERQAPPTLARAAAAADLQIPRAVATVARRQLLLHGPAYKIYSGLRARSDTHLFLFTDMLVVAVRLGAAPAYAAADSLLAVPMAPPATDVAAIPPGSRFRVQVVIPLAHRTTELVSQREGASKRAGEEVDAEERRIELQEARTQRACHIFERNMSEAIAYLVGHELITMQADVVASFLHRCTALNRRQTGSFLGLGATAEGQHKGQTSDEADQEKLFYHQVCSTFVGQCNIVGVPIDEALRSILSYIRLSGSRRATGVLMETLAVEWHARNREYGPVPGVYVPESQDVALNLVYSIMMLNSEVHNPLVRSDVQAEAIYQAFLSRFRAAVVDDPALASKRKGNVLRKRDQPRVVTIMEVPTECLRGIYERIVANRMVTCSDSCAKAAEFDVDWVRDASDIGGAGLTDEQVVAEMEGIYSDPGFRDGVLFNATSDTLPAKYNIDPPAWVRVRVRIPEPDPDFAVVVRVVGASVDVTGPPPGSGAEPIAILPSNRLAFGASASASFVIRPQQVGHFTIHFVPEGPRARYYNPIPPRKVAVEGAFMRHTFQLSWNRSGPGAQPNHCRHVFGLDSQLAKAHWVHALETALRSTAGVAAEDVLRCVEGAAQTLCAPAPARADGAATAGRATVASAAAAAQGFSPAQLFSALSAVS